LGSKLEADIGQTGSRGVFRAFKGRVMRAK
jgi:hypothetical protein